MINALSAAIALQDRAAWLWRETRQEIDAAATLLVFNDASRKRALIIESLCAMQTATSWAYADVRVMLEYAE